MVRLQAEMTNVLVPQFEAITPGSGCYLNEVIFLLCSVSPFEAPYQLFWEEGW